MDGTIEPSTALDELFCHEFVKDFRGTAAARRAGLSDGGAGAFASRALRRPEIKARISQIVAERRARVQVEADDVLRTLVQIANTDINELIEFRRTCCRHCWGIDHGYQWTDREKRAAHARHVKASRDAERKNEQPPEEPDFSGGTGFDATRDPHEQCPECNGEGVGSPFIRDTRDLGHASAAYAGVKITKEGIEVKLQDRMRALELLGKHLGMFEDSLKVRGELTVTGLAGRMRNRRPAAGVEDLV